MCSVGQSDFAMSNGCVEVRFLFMLIDFATLHRSGVVSFILEARRLERTGPGRPPLSPAGFRWWRSPVSRGVQHEAAVVAGLGSDARATDMAGSE